MKFSKVNSKMKNFQKQENSNLMKVEIMIQHDGLNRNNSVFRLENIQRAEHSLRNIPILGYIKKEEDCKDFDHHNMETKIVDTANGYELQVEYLESPIGVIPTDTNVRYEEIDGRTYLICHGYIWANYCKDAVDIINDSDDKKVSMEISVDNYSITDDGYVDIEDYKFLGLTILGDHVESGMYGTVMTKYSSRPDYKQALGEIYQEIYSLESKEVDVMENQVEEVVEEIVEETVVEEVVEAEVAQETETVEEVVEETVEEVVEEVQSEIIEPVIEEAVEVVEEEVVEENPLEVFSILFEEVPHSLSEIAVKLHEKFEAMTQELEVLTKFKADKDKEERTANIDVIISEYAELNQDDVESLRYDAIESKLDIDTFKEKLASLAYSKIKANKKQSYSVDTATSIVPIIEKTEENGYEPYGGIFK